MPDIGNVKDLVVSFFSERQMRTVEIGVDDIIAIYEDDSMELDDTAAVGELISKFVDICSDRTVGSLDFCVEARDELDSIREQIEESANKMRMMENYSQGKTRTFRRIRKGSRERNLLIDFVEQGLEDLNSSIEDRKFYEGGY